MKTPVARWPVSFCWLFLWVLNFGVSCRVKTNSTSTTYIKHHSNEQLLAFRSNAKGGFFLKPEKFFSGSPTCRKKCMQTFSQKCLCLFKKATEKQKKDYCSFLCWLAAKRKKKYSKQPGLRWICFQNRVVGRPRCGLSRSRRAGLLCPKLTPETKSSLKTVRNCQKAGTRKKTDCFFLLPLFPPFYFLFWSKSRPYLHKSS